MTTADSAYWRARLSALMAEHSVPGAALGILRDGQILDVATGVLSTATLVEALPEFSTPDDGSRASITIRQLLSHTSGLDDVYADTGDGDECVARYVTMLRGLPDVRPAGEIFSYCNTGIVLAGRVVEVIIGRPWNAALRERLIDPLGLTATITRPEEAVPHRVVATDPYRRSLVSVGLDGGAVTRLADDDLDHVVSAPEHGRWFVDSASTVDGPPVVTVRGRDGSVLVELERADVSDLVAAGWSAPERVRTVAADGETPIYGVLHKPYGFDPALRYPVVDHVYPGPQLNRVEPSFDPGPFGYDAEAVAALGFVVLAVDGRGTPGRDKAFHDHSYRNLGAAGGLEDHVAALRQLAGTRPWMDLDRVGIFGHSGGGFATVRALLTFPETYKVGVAESGNHDNRQYHAVWAGTYDGPHDPDAGARLSNTELADRLTGRLLLVHGEMDDNVTPYLTLRLVDRLIAANKDFDLLIVPGAEHGFVGYEHYVIRRRWDYLVRHLMGREPPAYRLADIPVDFGRLDFLLG